MKKEQYLKRIKNGIQSLTIDEQNEALQYYSDYLDDADDVEKAMEELGSPEEVAQQIIEKCANSLVSAQKTSSDDNKSSEKSFEAYDALFYSFKKVSSINLSLGAAEVVMTGGKEFSVETRGLNKNEITCDVDSNGILHVNNVRKLNINFFSHSMNRRVVPRILVTIPDETELERFELRVDAGSFITKNVSFACRKGALSVGAGNLVLNSFKGNNVSLRCGMGNLSINGALTGRTNIDCGMGAIRLELKGNSSDYSYDLKVGLGSFKFNDEKRSGVCQDHSEYHKENHFSVNCGMGSVLINVHKF